MQIDEQRIRDEYLEPMLDILNKYKADDQLQSDVIGHTNVIIDKVSEGTRLLVDGFELIQKAQLVVGKLIELINDHNKNVQLPTSEDLKLYHGASTILSIVGWSKDDDE